MEAIAQAIFKEWFVDFRFPGATGEVQDSELGLIPKGWEVNTLKDLTVKIGSGATPRGGSGVYLDEGIALIRSQNVYDSEFVWEGLARISDEAAELLRNVEVEQLSYQSRILSTIRDALIPKLMNGDIPVGATLAVNPCADQPRKGHPRGVPLRGSP